MPYYSYVLRSFKKDILYKGSTENIEKRLQTHNAGKVSFTSKHLPWELVLVEEFSTRAEALKREKWYKTGVGREWISKNVKDNKIG